MSLKRFGNFIEKRYNKNEFIRSIELMEIKFRELRFSYIRRSKREISNTCRMTICELLN